MTDAEAKEKVIEHDATLKQMNERLGSIESRLNAMDGRLDALGVRLLYVGGGLAGLMSLYKFL